MMIPPATSVPRMVSTLKRDAEDVPVDVLADLDVDGDGMAGHGVQASPRAPTRH